MANLLAAKARLAKRTLDLAGNPATIKRQDNSPTENVRGKIEDGDRTYSPVDTETAYRLYASRDDRPGEARVTGGRLNTEDPRILLYKDTVAQEDDRITFSDTGRTYQLDERIPRPTHVEFRTTFVNGQS